MKLRLANICLGAILLPFSCGTGLVGAATEIRVATFNLRLIGESPGDVIDLLSDPGSVAPRRLAEIIQRVDPDLLVLNEIDFDSMGEALELFHGNFLSRPQGGQQPTSFPHRFTAESNTGISSGFDLDNNGRTVREVGAVGYGEDAFGFGEFPGKFGMAVYSKFAIRGDQKRTFQKFLWKDMPGALLPDISVTPAPQDWYNPAEQEVFRLSSKSHWDLPIDIGGEIVHLLVAHPTPPTFDGGEDRNGKRNHDEIRLWADYVQPGVGDYLYDDAGVAGGIGEGVRFVICGDYNADPNAGDSVDSAIRQLLENPAVNASFIPRGASGSAVTSSFGLRVDYVLPSVAGLGVLGGGIFAPISGQPGADLVGASDHRLVWMDLVVQPLVSEAVRDLRIGIESGDVLISWQAEAGIDYQIEASPDLQAWLPVGGVLQLAVDGEASARDAGAAATGGRRYYRVGARFSAAGDQ